MVSERDPWRRYGLVEAYDQLARFKFRFDEIVDRVKTVPKEAIRDIQDLNRVPE
jgi:hypothetical protein